LTDPLIAVGFHVWEALALSEVTFLCETEDVRLVIITSDVDEERCRILQQQLPTMVLRPEAKASDVIAELWNLFPTNTASIQ
jgi:hypothetical protein